jgi:hypothetical protein
VECTAVEKEARVVGHGAMAHQLVVVQGHTVVGCTVVEMLNNAVEPVEMVLPFVRVNARNCVVNICKIK